MAYRSILHSDVVVVARPPPKCTPRLVEQTKFDDLHPASATMLKAFKFAGNARNPRVIWSDALTNQHFAIACRYTQTQHFAEGHVS